MNDETPLLQLEMKVSFLCKYQTFLYILENDDSYFSSLQLVPFNNISEYDIDIEITTFETGVRVIYIPIVSGSRMKEWSTEEMKLLFQMAKSAVCAQKRGRGISKSWISK